MKNLLFNLLLLFVSCAFACSSELEDPRVDNEVYKGYCGVESVEFSRGDSRAYVPNVFTPDAKEANRHYAPPIRLKTVQLRKFFSGLNLA
jgi:hypothetical protein